MEIKITTIYIMPILCFFLLCFTGDKSFAAQIQLSELPNQIRHPPLLETADVDTSQRNHFWKEDPKLTELQQVYHHERSLDTQDSAKQPSMSDFKHTLTDNDIRNTRWPALSTSGKRNLQDRYIVGEFADYDGSDERSKRKWTRFSSWGKRHNDIGSKWTRFSSWGKRNVGNGSKWTRFSSWGKRKDGNGSKWTRFSSWGKRNDGNGNNENEPLKGITLLEKLDDGTDKRWKEKSVWGKQDISENPEWSEKSQIRKRPVDKNNKWKNVSVWGKRQPVDTRKTWKSISAWGKRDSDFETEKKWKEMKAWGKREDKKEQLSALSLKEDKISGKTWDNAAAVRENVKMVYADNKLQELPLETSSLYNKGLRWQRSVSQIRNWRDMGVWGKRPSWSKTGFTSWGKRSSATNRDTFENEHNLEPPLNGYEARPMQNSDEVFDQVPEGDLTHT